MPMYLGDVQVSMYGGSGELEIVASNLQSKTASPSESKTTVTADSGYDGLSQVTVNAISNTYVGSGITKRTSSSLSASGATVTAPAGYYSASVSKSVATAELAEPTISVSSAGLITATEEQETGGYVEASTKSATYQLTTKSAQTYTPGTSNQTISSGRYLTGTQTIKGDANLVGNNIISGKSIFGVDGTVVIQKYYTGTSAPSSNLGSDGDIYLKTS